MEIKANPMHLVKLMNQAQRCSAKSKRTGCRCQAPAVSGKTVCRMHGARAGAPKGKANGAWLGGGHTNDALARRRELGELLRQARRLLGVIEN